MTRSQKNWDLKMKPKPDLYKWLLEAEEEIAKLRSRPALKHAKRLKYVLEMWENEMLARMAKKVMKKK